MNNFIKYYAELYIHGYLQTMTVQCKYNTLQKRIFTLTNENSF